MSSSTVSLHFPLCSLLLAVVEQAMLAADTHIVKIWDQDTGDNFTSLEPSEGSINDVCVGKDDGLVLLGCDAPKIQVRTISIFHLAHDNMQCCVATSVVGMC